jgi:hypothetical protein
MKLRSSAVSPDTSTLFPSIYDTTPVRLWEIQLEKDVFLDWVSILSHPVESSLVGEWKALGLYRLRSMEFVALSILLAFLSDLGL